MTSLWSALVAATAGESPLQTLQLIDGPQKEGQRGSVAYENSIGSRDADSLALVTPECILHLFLSPLNFASLSLVTPVKPGMSPFSLSGSSSDLLSGEFTSHSAAEETVGLHRLRFSGHFSSVPALQEHRAPTLHFLRSASSSSVEKTANRRTDQHGDKRKA